jgi:hypothetical protein
MAARLMTSVSRATFGVDHVQHGKTVTTIECRGGPATADTLAHRSVWRRDRKRKYIPDARKRERDGEDAVNVNLEENHRQQDSPRGTGLIHQPQQVLSIRCLAASRG